jgi:hypothetical protein
MAWQPVLKIIPDGRPEHTTAGFDFGATYEFRRGFDGEPWVGRGEDFHPQFNIAGLWFRPKP